MEPTSAPTTTTVSSPAPAVKRQKTTATVASSSGKKKRGRNFTDQEDEELCHAWLCVSAKLDLRTGSQKSGTFWEAVAENFAQRMADLLAQQSTTTVLRPKRSLDSRWSHIRVDVLHFCDVLRQVQLAQPNVDESAHLAQAAQRLESDAEYTKKYKSFKRLGCWRILHESPKWQQLLSALTTDCSANVSQLHQLSHLSTNATNPRSTNLDEKMVTELEAISLPLLEPKVRPGPPPGPLRTPEELLKDQEDQMLLRSMDGLSSYGKEFLQREQKKIMEKRKSNGTW